MHTVTYVLEGQENIIETENALDALRASQTALSRGATECIINDDGFHFRMTAFNEISHG